MSIGDYVILGTTLAVAAGILWAMKWYIFDKGYWK